MTKEQLAALVAAMKGQTGGRHVWLDDDFELPVTDHEATILLLICRKYDFNHN